MEDTQMARKHMKICLMMEEGTGNKEREKRTKAHPWSISNVISFIPHKRTHDVEIINPTLQIRKQRLGAIKELVTANKWQGWVKALQ